VRVVLMVAFNVILE